MRKLLTHIRIEINNNLFLKNPESSDLGKRIINKSILLIDKSGFEQFTFKKLGKELKSNESSVYRYFENKHKLLLYLASWYWGWKEYQFVFSTANISDATLKLEKAIQVLTQQVEKDSFVSHVDEVILNRVIVNEFSKSYLSKEVEKENKEGLFETYNRLVLRLKDLIQEVDSEYPYPSSLANTILEGSLHQHFLKEHFPAMTETNGNISPSEYFLHMVKNILNPQKDG